MNPAEPSGADQPDACLERPAVREQTHSEDSQGGWIVAYCRDGSDQSVPLVSAEDRARLEAIVADRNRAQKHVARARIILGSAERLPVARVARRAGVGRPAVWRWQERFAAAGVDGLLRDATRKPGKAPLATPLAQRVVALTCAEPPGAATHSCDRATP